MWSWNIYQHWVLLVHNPGRQGNAETGCCRREEKWRVLPHLHNLHNTNSITLFFILFFFCYFYFYLEGSVMKRYFFLRGHHTPESVFTSPLRDAAADSSWTGSNTFAASTHLLDRLGCRTSPSSAVTVRWSDCETQREFGWRKWPQIYSFISGLLIKR